MGNIHEERFINSVHYEMSDQTAFLCCEPLSANSAIRTTPRATIICVRNGRWIR